MSDFKIVQSAALDPNTVLMLTRRPDHTATIIEANGAFRAACAQCGFATEWTTSEVEAFSAATAHGLTGVKIENNPPAASGGGVEG